MTPCEVAVAGLSATRHYAHPLAPRNQLVNRPPLSAVASQGVPENLANRRWI